MYSDGSATFAGPVQIGEWNTSDGSKQGAYIFKEGSFQANRTSGTASLFQGSVNGNVTSQINADGSATFAGTLKSSTFDNTSNDASAHGIRIENIPDSNISQFDFQVSTSRPDDYEAFRINKGSAKKVTVFANGSAYFATDKIWLRDDGGITTFGNRLQVRSSTANGTDKFFSGASGATGVTSGSTERFAVYTDGSAKFDGNVGIVEQTRPHIGCTSNQQFNQSHTFESTGSNAKIYFASAGSTSNGNYLQQAGDKTEFFTAGSRALTMLGNSNVGIGTDAPSSDLQVGTYGSSGVRFYKTGYTQVRDDNGSGGFECYKDGSGSANRTVRITTAGNASFNGKITAGDYDLEALPSLS